jgi:hypothetical protein
LTRKIVLASSNGSSSASSRIGGALRAVDGFAAAGFRDFGFATVDAGLRAGARFAPVERLRAGFRVAAFRVAGFRVAGFRVAAFALGRVLPRPPGRVEPFGLAFFAPDLEPRFFFDAMLSPPAR